MSWKKRRQWANSKPDANLAPWVNFFTVVSIVITLTGLSLYKLPIIGGIIAGLWFLSLVTTPWLFLMGLASGTWNYGFPEFKKKKK